LYKIDAGKGDKSTKYSEDTIKGGTMASAWIKTRFISKESRTSNKPRFKEESTHKRLR